MRRDVLRRVSPTALHSDPGPAQSNVGRRIETTPSARGSRAPSSIAGVPTATSTTSRSRGVIDRARAQQNAPDAGYITDVDNENDLASFVSGRIGDEIWTRMFS